MKLRITRPEVYANCDDPTDLTIRQGYYVNDSEGTSVESAIRLACQTVPILAEYKGESLDVQDNATGKYIGRYRFNSTGDIVKLHRVKQDGWFREGESPNEFYNRVLDRIEDNT